MKRTVAISFSLLISIFAIVLINGCTAVGFGVGYFVDSKAEYVDYPLQHGLDSLEFKDELLITLKNGSTQKGKFSGVTVVDPDEYAVLYEELRAECQSSFSLPALGDTLTIYLKPERNKEYKERLFDGFMFSSFESGRQTLIKARYFKGQSSENVNLNRIFRITNSSGIETDVGELERFIASGGLNSITALVLSDKHSRQKVRLVDIEDVKIIPKKKAAVLFAGLGLVVDIAILAITRPAPENSGSSNSGGGG